MFCTYIQQKKQKPILFSISIDFTIEFQTMYSDHDEMETKMKKLNGVEGNQV